MLRQTRCRNITMKNETCVSEPAYSINMGIKHLNKYIVDQCKPGVRTMQFSELRNKTVVVDISIYLYKFQMSESLVENMYIMLTLFEQNGIHPIFIFDGKAPAEKRELLNKRYHERMKAESQYGELCDQLQHMEDNANDTQRQQLTCKMQTLKRKMVYLHKTDVAIIQSMIDHFGFSFFYSATEADKLCHMFVKYGIAWACMSEDMDMFVYGIPRILRYMSLYSQTCVLYDTHRILQELHMEHHTLVNICILSGTDYNPAIRGATIHRLFDLFREYRALGDSRCFMEWLRSEKFHYTAEEYEKVGQVKEIFTREESEDVRVIARYCDTVFQRRYKRQGDIRSILEKSNFVYPLAIQSH